MRNRCLVALVVVLVTALLGVATYSGGFTENAPSANAVQRAAAAKLTWQTVWGAGATQWLDRAKVPGGWLLLLKGRDPNGGSGGTTFYPDPKHDWNGSSLP